MSKKITEITRKEIFALFSEGYIDNSFSLFGESGERILYAYNGDISEIDFLSDLYQLDKMPSLDHRFSNAKDDILQHTVNNDDYKQGWVFYDARFNLKDCDDEELLKFICKVFHPSVRSENSYWKGLLDNIQVLLKPDGYELHIAERISGREVYAWRELTDLEVANNKFIPFSQRYKNSSLQIPGISINKRKALVELMHRLEENICVTDDTGWQDYKYSCQIVMDEIKEFYIPKAYNDKDEYVEESDFNRFVMRTSPKCVFDVIELYPQFETSNFENEVNNVLSNYGYKLIDRKMMPMQNQIKAENPKEPTLRDLVLEAERYFKKQDLESKQRALEKIWDAFERMKTYYSPDKKKSTNQIINIISNGDAELYNKLDAEFFELGNIGNNYQIRHFETNKKPINDVRIKEYLYTRCLALINMIIRFVEK